MVELLNENLETLVAGGAPPEFLAPATPTAASKEARRKALEAELAALDAPALEVITQEQAKLLTAWNEKTGWPALTPDEIKYAAERGIETPQVVRSGKVICRLITPQRIRLLNIAEGLAQEPVKFVTNPSGPPSARPGPSSRQILIVDFDVAYDGPLRGIETNAFESAAEAARILDVTPQALSSAIRKASGKPWKVKGVTMQYVDLYITDDQNFHAND